MMGFGSFAGGMASGIKNGLQIYKAWKDIEDEEQRRQEKEDVRKISAEENASANAEDSGRAAFSKAFHASTKPETVEGYAVGVPSVDVGALTDPGKADNASGSLMMTGGKPVSPAPESGANAGGSDPGPFPQGYTTPPTQMQLINSMRRTAARVLSKYPDKADEAKKMVDTADELLASAAAKGARDAFIGLRSGNVGPLNDFYNNFFDDGHNGKFEIDPDGRHVIASYFDPATGQQRGETKRVPIDGPGGVTEMIAIAATPKGVEHIINLNKTHAELEFRAQERDDRREHYKAQEKNWDVDNARQERVAQAQIAALGRRGTEGGDGKPDFEVLDKVVPEGMFKFAGSDGSESVDFEARSAAQEFLVASGMDPVAFRSRILPMFRQLASDAAAGKITPEEKAKRLTETLNRVTGRNGGASQAAPAANADSRTPIGAAGLPKAARPSREEASSALSAMRRLDPRLLAEQEDLRKKFGGKTGPSEH